MGSSERFVVTRVCKNQYRVEIDEEISLRITRITENAFFSNNVLNFRSGLSQCSGKFTSNRAIFHRNHFSERRETVELLNHLAMV